MRIHDKTFVDRFLEPWNDHDVEGALALMTDDCVWEITRGSEPHGTRIEGAEAVRAAIAGAFRAMPDIHYEPVHSSFGQDLVVVELLVTGTLADGRPAKFQACDVMTVRDGKIAAKRSYRKLVDWSGP
ncbi:MAG: nuclear transport factor 2 family protein [Reyranella sp.]|nr:nuclear transport factor 2 family protein [Reyranella sp.]